MPSKGRAFDNGLRDYLRSPSPSPRTDQSHRRMSAPYALVDASFRIAVSTSFSILMAVNLVSMTARSCGISKWRGVSPELFAMPEVAGGEDSGDGSQIFSRNAQDDSPRCGLAPQRKSALRSFRCRVAAGVCETHSAVNIRKEFEKWKPRRSPR